MSKMYEYYMENVTVFSHFSNKGNDHFKEGKYEQAVICYTEAMNLDPSDAILPANRAIAYLKLNK